MRPPGLCVSVAKQVQSSSGLDAHRRFRFIQPLTARDWCHKGPTPPEPFKPIRRQRRVARAVVDGAVPLDLGPGIDPVFGVPGVHILIA